MAQDIPESTDGHDFGRRREVGNIFLVEEYKTLREEIRDCKIRIFRIMSVGIITVPALNLIAKELVDFARVAVVVPIVIFAFGLFLISENRSIMRCACYIRTKIEPRVKSAEPEFIGWENWLELPDEDFPKKRVDITSSISFLTLFLIYYVVSAYVACDFVAARYPEFIIAATTTYAIFGIAFLMIIIINQWLIRGTTYGKKPSRTQFDRG